MAAPDTGDMAGAVEAMTARWLMGTPSLEAAPGPWREALSGLAAPERELRLLALAGQFAQMSLRPTPPPALAAGAPLPALALPTINTDQRPIFRRLTATKDPPSLRGLLAFLAGRGAAPHPADWLPGDGEDDLPDVYAPWIEWAAGRQTPRRSDGNPYAADELTAQTWDDFPPATRRVRLAALRRTDPTQARTLLEAKAPGESAEVRARMVECLAHGLSEADAPWLESLLGDRSAKVKAVAQHLLARLGRGRRKDDAPELAAFLERSKKGILRRRLVVSPSALKTDAQRARRLALFETVDFAALAAALELEPVELAGSWAFGVDVASDRRFTAMAAESGPAPAVMALIESLLEKAFEYRVLILALAPRLEPPARRELVEKILRRTDVPLADVLAIGGPGLDIDDANLLLGGSASGSRLASLMGEAGSDTASAASRVMDSELFALGLMASATAAAEVLRHAGNAGLHLADPRLDMLRLNAALSSKGRTDG